MITFHIVDSISIMNAIEIIEQHNWNQTTEAQSNKQEACDKASLLLKALRNALGNPIEPIKE
jgi:hypothetical protein